MFESKVSYRKCGHEGVDEFLWITSDTGAYGHEKDGPLFDWIQGKDSFMETVRNFNTVVQAGGNCGMYPRFYKNYFKNVYTFEPDDTNYHCLDINCVGEGYHKFHGGLGSTTDSFTLKNRSVTNVGTHKIVDIPGNVKMYRIDDLGLAECDLIHLDVEGYESKVLQGSIETIKKFKPVVITENAGGSDILLSLGYRVHAELRMDTVFTPGRCFYNE